MNKLIIGVGTGRCGTKSLTKLLEIQDSTKSTHERFGPRVRWNCPPNLWPKRLWNDTLESDKDIVADIHLGWTAHIDTFLTWAEKTGRQVRVVGLKRDKEQTVDSYDKWKPYSDHWSFHGYRETKPDEWDHCYPTFECDNKREGITKFWEYVYHLIHGWESMDQRVRCFRTENLNTKVGVKEILSFCGYEDPRIEEGIKINAPSIQSARNSEQWTSV